MQKKIAIYDKWLNSMGGGEKVATVMAEALSKAGHAVHLISNYDVDKAELEEKMGADLSKVEIVIWYERSYASLTQETKKYDVFINVSFLDHLPSIAKASIYYIHFPTPIKTTLFGFIKYETILPFLRRFLIIPEVTQGLTPLDEVYARGGRWLSRKNKIVFSNTPKSFNLTLRIYAQKMDQKVLNNITFSSHNSVVKQTDKYVDPGFNVMVYQLFVNTKGSSPVLEILVRGDLRNNALGLVSMTIRDIRFFAWNFLKRYLPRYEMALYGSSSYKVAEGLDTYDLILANSEFSRLWTKKYLSKDSTVVYPPVDVHKFKAGKKKNIVLTVGRFFVGGHSKRQDVLVDTFKSMIDSGAIDKTWELHLVGGVASGKEHLEYLNNIKQSAKGYPIYFHFSASFRTLKRLYSQAKIYWHATGFGSSENQEPIKMEHFGITPVEAMSAGAVPLVYKAGGVIETVGGESTQLWETKEELALKTAYLIGNKKKLQEISEKMQRDANKFSKEVFVDKLLASLDKVLNKNADN